MALGWRIANGADDVENADGGGPGMDAVAFVVGVVSDCGGGGGVHGDAAAADGECPVPGGVRGDGADGDCAGGDVLGVDAGAGGA